MASLSGEEENYIRMSLLVTGISPRAARTFFDSQFPPACLDATMRKEYSILLDLKKKHRINELQWKNLFPRFPATDMYIKRNAVIRLEMCGQFFNYVSNRRKSSSQYGLLWSISQTHYQVLGVRQTATDEEIKSAYKQLCKKLHPDVNKNDPKAHDKFTEVQNAYSTLSGKRTRYEYDQELRYGQTFGPAESDEDLLRRYRSTKHADDSYYGNRSYGNSYYGNTSKGKNFNNDPVMRALRYISRNFVKIVAFGIMINCSFILLSQRYVKNQLDEKDKRLHAEMQYLNQHFHNHGFQKAPKMQVFMFNSP
ncbi:unnamed protein product [Mytilus coruscus]|uniref:J domain-containing protein n=1 Tax=Mytilus coruscus TaxID=42192 RepID=A0A6J8BBR2_MYTCO|nr:unnamed protein product [Mytilus coruscus]